MKLKQQEKRIASLGRDLGVSYQTMYNTMTHTQLKPTKYQVIPSRRWTPEEERLVASISHRGETREIAEMLNRTIRSVQSKKRRLI